VAAIRAKGRFAEAVGFEAPIIQAPMAGSNGSALAVAVCRAGGLGSLPCALLDAGQILAEVAVIRSHTDKPFNLNFFCHRQPTVERHQIAGWHHTLARFYQERGLPVPDLADFEVSAGRRPFDREMCDVVKQVRPPVVSFHFGLPEDDLYDRVRALGCRILCSATTTEEAVFLESRGVDAIIAQGVEAGGHRGMFLNRDIHNQPGTLALVPQVVDAVAVPVIAAGGIGDNRGIVASLMLGADCVQIGSLFLFCREALTSKLHLEALNKATDHSTALTNLFTGRPARGIVNYLMREIGPMSDAPPPFPLAGSALAALRSAAQDGESSDFTPLWAGQAAAMGKAYLGLSATEVMQKLTEPLS